MTLVDQILYKIMTSFVVRVNIQLNFPAFVNLCNSLLYKNIYRGPIPEKS